MKKKYYWIIGIVVIIGIFTLWLITPIIIGTTECFSDSDCKCDMCCYSCICRPQKQGIAILCDCLDIREGKCYETFRNGTTIYKEIDSFTINTSISCKCENFKCTEVYGDKIIEC